MKRIEWFYLPVALAGVLCLLVILSAEASAGDGNPCAEDIAKFCKDVKPGEIMDCLEKHESELSEACRAHEEMMGGKKVEMREEVRRMKIFREACKEDMAKFCKDVQSEKGGIEKCLGARESELSAVCRERLKAVLEEETKGKNP